jgi:tryptophan 2,3-dioxygenase
LEETIANENVFRDPALECVAQQEVKVKFEERYKTSKNKWFFQKLWF